MPLEPGNVLQLMYLESRLAKITPGRFLEIGPGNGDITSLLLHLGWTCSSLNLEPSIVAHLNSRFSNEICEGKFMARCADFNKQEVLASVDLVISSTVMENLDDQQQSLFWQRSADWLGVGGNNDSPGTCFTRTLGH